MCLRVLTVEQQVKDPALPLRQCRFHPWLGTVGSRSSVAAAAFNPCLAWELPYTLGMAKKAKEKTYLYVYIYLCLFKIISIKR